VAKRRYRIYEVGISYQGRTYEEGKKIGWKDGVRAVWCLIKYSWKEGSLPQPQIAVAPTGSAPSRPDLDISDDSEARLVALGVDESYLDEPYDVDHPPN